MATIPAEKLYSKVEIPPPNKLPSTVLTATTTMASSGPSKSNASIEKMLDMPIFAPGKNNGGNSPSIIKDISAIAESTANIANRFAEKYLVVSLVLFIAIIYFVTTLILLGLHTIVPPLIVIG